MVTHMAALLAFGSWLAVASPLSQGWTYERIVDDFTDEVRHFAEVSASEGDGVIWIICFEDTSNVEIRVSTGLWLDSKDDQFDKKPVRYRIDKSEPVSTRWPGGELMAFAWESEALRFSRALTSGQTEVLVELTAWDGDRQRAKFSLRNSRRAIGRVFDACGQVLNSR